MKTVTDHPPVFQTTTPLILASASPRRRSFLAELGLDFTVVAADIDEIPLKGEKAAAFALRMAEEKAASVAVTHPESFVIGADTVVTLNGVILGKPRNETDALAILRTLSGVRHEVITALSLNCRKLNIKKSTNQRTSVTFASFPDDILQAYIRSGEPMDKAGSYGIQGAGAFLVKEINGSCSNVIGLPVNLLIELLLEHGVISGAQNIAP